MEDRKERNFLTAAELLIMIYLWLMCLLEKKKEKNNPDVSRINMEKATAPLLPVHLSDAERSSI